MKRMWMWRILMADPPIPGADRMTLNQMADAHELLDLRELTAHRAIDRRRAEQEREQPRRRR